MVGLAKKLAQRALYGAACALSVGCGTGLELEEKLVIAMYGVFDAPADASGNAEPKFQGYKLTDVSMTRADGSLVDLYTEDEPYAARIINRSQIIHEADLADYVDEAFTAITVTFDPEVEADGKGEEKLMTTLTTPTAMLLQAVTVEPGIEQRLNVRVQWKNTITRDEDADPIIETMSPPTFELELADE